MLLKTAQPTRPPKSSRGSTRRSQRFAAAFLPARSCFRVLKMVAWSRANTIMVKMMAKSPATMERTSLRMRKISPLASGETMPAEVE